MLKKNENKLVPTDFFTSLPFLRRYVCHMCMTYICRLRLYGSDITTRKKGYHMYREGHTSLFMISLSYFQMHHMKRSCLF